MARRMFPSRLELKRREGSSRAAPWRTSSSRPSCRTRRCRRSRRATRPGVPIHFHSSRISGSACLISARIRPSVSPRQSSSSAILLLISSTQTRRSRLALGQVATGFCQRWPRRRGTPAPRRPQRRSRKCAAGGGAPRPDDLEQCSDKSTRVQQRLRRSGDGTREATEAANAAADAKRLNRGTKKGGAEDLARARSQRTVPLNDLAFRPS
jgi:hypothetical protein